MKKYLLAMMMFASLQSLIAQRANNGIFDANADIGDVFHRGSTVYNPATQEYLVTGSGANICGDHDELHFVWKKMKGDFILRANATFLGKGTDPHRNTGWMVRSSLDTN